MPAGPKSITGPVTSVAGETHNSKSGTEIVETTSQRKTRPKFVRQKSFEIDSDSTDTSLADIRNMVSEVRDRLFNDNLNSIFQNINILKTNF